MLNKFAQVFIKSQNMDKLIKTVSIIIFNLLLMYTFLKDMKEIKGRQIHSIVSYSMILLTSSP